jgi:flavorubredoxin
VRSVEVAGNLFWVGVKDPDLRVFDINVKTDYGTTYNSYLIMGEKKALVDAVKFGFQDDFLSKIEEHTAVEEIDYLIVNHTEPDHSGCIPLLLKKNPKLKLFCSKPALPFLKNVLNDASVQIEGVKTGDRLDLGGLTLEFQSAPFLHWPDTMFTYLVEEKVLFPCDGYASHFSPHDGMFYRPGDQVVDHAAWYYYDCIMRPYAPHCRKATEEALQKEISVCAPSHGPINNSEPKRFMQKYLEWTEVKKLSDKKLIVVAYASSYGNTQRLAEEIAATMQKAEVDVRLFDVAATPESEKRDLLEAADGLVFGAPTFVNDIVKPMWETLLLLPTVSTSGKRAATFGSYGWSGQAPGMMQSFLQSIKIKVYEPLLKARLVPSEEDLQEAATFARGFLEFLQEN